MASSVQNNSCCWGFFAPFVEGKNCFERSFGPIPPAMEQDLSVKKLAYRVKEFVKGFCLCIPFVNIIVYLALRCFADQQRSNLPPSISPINPSPGTVNAQCPPSMASPGSTAVVPTKVDVDSSSTCDEDDGYVPEVGLPNFSESPILDNVCWLNSACQTFFRSPVLVKRIFEVERLERERKLQGDKKPSEIIRLLKEMIVTLRLIAKGKGDKAGIPKIQKEMILFYKRDIDTNFKIGSQHRTNPFVHRVMTDLNLKYSHVQQNENRSPESYTRPTIVFGLHHETYLQAIAKWHMWGNTTTIKQEITKIPSVLVLEIPCMSHATFDKVPRIADFSSIFSSAIQTQHKQLLYKLVSGPHHSNPKNPVSGHLTCQQEKDGNHYDDLRVNSIKDQIKVDKNFRDAPFHVWEIIDPTLVDKSYELKES